MAWRSFLQGPDHGRAKMKRVPEVLQFSVIIKRRRALSVELEFLQEFEFLLGRIAAHSLVPKEFLEPLLFLRLNRLAFDKLKFLGMPREKSTIQHDFHAKGRKVDIPGFD